MRILLIIPPMNQLNAPYPSVAYLAGFMRKRGFKVDQVDASLDLFLRLFSCRGIEEMLRVINPRSTNISVRYLLENADTCRAAIEPVIRFLQGTDPSLCHRIVQGNLMVEGPRFSALDEMNASYADGIYHLFGTMGVMDEAVYRCSLFIDDLCDAIAHGIDKQFSPARYGEKLSLRLDSFDQIHNKLENKPGYIDTIIDTLTMEYLDKYKPDCIGITVPFPGSFYGALRIAATIKRIAPGTIVVLGGGYISTELRSVGDSRLFDYVDYLCFDDGQEPFLRIVESICIENCDCGGLIRTMHKENGSMVVKNAKATICSIQDYGPPDYSGLPIDRYISLVEMPNPMHRLWSQHRWNKMMLSHGCYWGKCRFCDTTLDYIHHFETAPASLLVDWIEEVVGQTKQTGFHFVDEAISPDLIVELSEELIKRRNTISWWGNIRFEKRFTPAIIDSMADSGCIGVSGGLEAADDRLLKLLKKGITVASAAQVMHSIASRGIMVHAYLMYGIPTQTEQEYVDALERVRQLFAASCIHSAFWHRFSLTKHSVLAQAPDVYGMHQVQLESTSFAQNDLDFVEKNAVNHEILGMGLQKASYNFMLGIGLDCDVRSWFSVPTPKTTVGPKEVEKIIRYKMK